MLARCGRNWSALPGRADLLRVERNVINVLPGALTPTVITP
jgi:hypothetical protein